MRIVLIALAICAGLAAGCARLPDAVGSPDDDGFRHRDPPGSIWKKNPVPDGDD
jgi:hypothetical protein